MAKKSELKFDGIGYWSEIKLDIIRDYASAYSTILAAQKKPPLYHVYIDGFSGAGLHVSKTTKERIPGSPVNALNVNPPFREYHLIDLNPKKTAFLQELVGDRSDVHIYDGDCNSILLGQVFPQVRFDEYRRGLCLLDPYGLHLNWEVISAAGQMKSIDMFLNFPVADMNRNVIWRNPEGMRQSDLDRMAAFWGDDSWKQIAYTTERNLFGLPEREDNETVAEGFRERLKKIAGFRHVPKPLAMRNTRGAVVYYLFFASQKPVASSIVEDIFKKYQERGVR
jgi:three-Cys-motif partner protein